MHRSGNAQSADDLDQTPKAQRSKSHSAKVPPTKCK